jgi:hypothetical protein
MIAKRPDLALTDVSLQCNKLTAIEGIAATKQSFCSVATQTPESKETPIVAFQWLGKAARAIWLPFILR